MSQWKEWEQRLKYSKPTVHGRVEPRKLDVTVEGVGATVEIQ